MKIFVNSRLIIEKSTGIQNYITNLYQQILKCDKINEYAFIQHKATPVIGNTKIIKTLNGLGGNLLFDCFLVNEPLKAADGEKIIFHGTSFILPFIKKRDVKFVLTVHDLSFKLFPGNHSKLFNICYDYILKKSLKSADIIIAVSENTKNDLIKIYNTPPDKICVTYLAGDNFFDVSGLTLKRYYNQKYFLAIAGLPKRKNLVSVIIALSKSSILKKYKLVIAGHLSDSSKKEIIDLAKDLGVANNIHLTGYISKEDLRSLYHYATFFVYPSFYEGFGIPVLESMMSMCPVIVSNTSCLPEVVPFGYQYLVDPYSTDDIKQKMEHLILSPIEEKQKIVAENYSFSKEFSWENCAKQTIEIFKLI